MNRKQKPSRKPPETRPATREAVAKAARDKKLPAAAVDEAMKHPDPLARLNQIAERRDATPGPAWKPVERPAADPTAAAEPSSLPSTPPAASVATPATNGEARATPPATSEYSPAASDEPVPTPVTCPITELVCTLRLPMVDPAGKYISRHAEVNALSDEQAATFKALVLGLEASGAQLENGRYVHSNADGLRWLLEQLAAARRPPSAA